MDKLQMAHDFSMEVFRKVGETLELLVPTAGLAIIIIIGILIICSIIGSIIKKSLELLDTRR